MRNDRLIPEEREDPVSSLLDQSTDPVLICRRGAIIAANDRCARLLGSDTADELVGQSLLTLVAPEHHRDVDDALQRASSAAGAEETVSATLAFAAFPPVAADLIISLTRWQSQSAVCIRARSNRTFRGIGLERASLPQAGSQVHGGLILTDSKGRVVYVSPAFEGASGFSNEELQGKVAHEVLLSPSDGGNEHPFGVESLSGNRSFRRSDGSSFEACGVVTSLGESDDCRGGFVVLVQPSEEAMEEDSTLQQAPRMKAIGRFAGGIAHQLNNIFMVIGTCAEMLLSSRASEVAQQSRMDLEQALKGAVSFTDDLLLLSRNEAEDLALVSVTEFLSRLRPLLVTVAGTKIQLATDLGLPLAYFRADEKSLQKALVGLTKQLMGATLACGDLSFRAALCSVEELPPGCRTRCHSSVYFHLSVGRNGLKFDDHEVPFLFEPFLSTGSLRTNTGLHLASLYALAQQSGGLAVVSTHHEGTIFDLYFPAVHTEPRSAATRVEHRKWDRSPTILLVDDEAVLRQVLRDALLGAGYDVLEAPDSETALAIIRSRTEPIDVLVTDLVMPGGDGHQLAQAVVAERPEIRVIYMSGFTDDARVRAYVSSSEILFMQKPFRSRQLVLKIREMLGQES